MLKVKIAMCGLLMLLLSTKVYSDGFEAWDFKPINGSLQDTIAWLNEAKAVHERLGGSVEYWQHDVMGNNVVSYIIRFDTGENWASFKDKLSEDDAWQSWINANYATFSSHLVESFYLGNVFNPNATSSVWEDINIVYFSAWETADGKTAADLLTSMQTSASIQDKFDLNPMVYSSGLGAIYFVTGAASWSEWQTNVTKRNESTEWVEYWSTAGRDPAGEFVQQATSVRIQ